VLCQCGSTNGFTNPNNTFKSQRPHYNYVVEKDGKRYEFIYVTKFAKEHKFSEHALRLGLEDKPNKSGFKLISKDFI